jgi:hypothetical protein
MPTVPMLSPQGRVKANKLGKDGLPREVHEVNVPTPEHIVDMPQNDEEEATDPDDDVHEVNVPTPGQIVDLPQNDDDEGSGDQANTRVPFRRKCRSSWLR